MFSFFLGHNDFCAVDSGNPCASWQKPKYSQKTASADSQPSFSASIPRIAPLRWDRDEFGVECCHRGWVRLPLRCRRAGLFTVERLFRVGRLQRRRYDDSQNVVSVYTSRPVATVSRDHGIVSQQKVLVLCQRRLPESGGAWLID